jgi:hypothetical protein
VNDESLRRANAFLAAIASRVQPGEVLEATPAEVGSQVGLSEPLAAARAVRALLARRRLEAVDGNYRLLDPKPLEPGEPESIPRKPRRRKDSGGGAAARGSRSGPATYSDVGHVAIDRLVELGREVGTLRSSARQAKEEAREARSAKDDAERRAGELLGRVHDLEAKLEMAEQNLRMLLAAARGGKTSDEPVGSTEMEAILGVLKGG